MLITLTARVVQISTDNTEGNAILVFTSSVSHSALCSAVFPIK